MGRIGDEAVAPRPALVGCDNVAPGQDRDLLATVVFDLLGLMVNRSKGATIAGERDLEVSAV